MAQRPTLDVVAQLVDNLTGPLRQTAETVTKVAEGMKTALEVVGVTLSAAALGEFFKSTVEAANAAEQSMSRMVLAVNNAGQSYGSWKPKIDETVEGLTKITRYSETDFHTALTNMISLTNNVPGIL